MTVMVDKLASTQSAGAMAPQLVEQRAKDDENDALGALHKADFALANEGFGAGAGVADHHRRCHAEGGEHDVEEAVAARVIDEQAKEQSDVGVAVEDGIEEGAEDGNLVGLASDAAVDHVEQTGADDDEARVDEHADVVFSTRIAEEERRRQC